MVHPHFKNCFTNIAHSAVLLVIFSFLSIAPTFAQKEGGTEESYTSAQVNLDGNVLFSVRGAASFPADERAKIIAERIELAAVDKSLSPDSVKVIHNNDYDQVMLGEILLLRVFDSDGQMEGISRESFSIAARLRIIKAINTYRYERSFNVLLKNTILSAAAIAVLLISLLLLRILFRRASEALERRLKSRFEKIESKSFHLIRSNQILVTLGGFIRTVKYLLIFILSFSAAQYILGLFPWTRFISVSLIGIFVKPFSDFGKAIINFIPNLAFLIVIFFITRYLLKIVKLLFQGLGQGTISIGNFDAEWAPTTYKIVRILLIAFAVIIAYPYIPGSDSEAFKGVSLFLGILFSLGSTSVIGNLIAGYTMTYRKTFKIGDVVQIDNTAGEVVDIKLFVTRLRTHKNEEVIIPNSVILSNNVINYSTHASGKGLIIHTTVGIGYETPWRLVEGMLKTAADRTQGIEKDPPPYVLQKALGDFSVNYEINAYTKDPMNRFKIYTELHQHILDVFNENSVQIMTPAYEGDPDQPKIVPKEEWFTPVAEQHIKKEQSQQELFDRFKE